MESVLPHFAEGPVVAGFGRGSRELGIPTANFPEDVIRSLPAQFDCGVYFGWAQVGWGGHVHKMAMCVGWNPFYQNTVKTMETHILHQFPGDFYGEHLKVVVLGFLRPMCDFDSLDALITAIHQDNANASRELDRPEHLAFMEHAFFSSPPPPSSTSSPPQPPTSPLRHNGEESSSRSNGAVNTGSKCGRGVCPTSDSLSTCSRSGRGDNQTEGMNGTLCSKGKDEEGVRNAPCLSSNGSDLRPSLSNGDIRS